MRIFDVYSFLAGGHYQLTPLYDVISAWPIAGPKQNQIHGAVVELQSVLASASTCQAACDQLIQAANDHGGRDNITAIVARAR